MHDDNEQWLDAASEETDDVVVEEYDIVSSPNDWNFTTIVNFIDSGAMQIPEFQRNYVWDRKRASKLIESLLIGLPVPQVFLYEERRNKFLVIDGQQRLLSLYFFAKGRFPRSGVRGKLRNFIGNGEVNHKTLHDDELFENFKLLLPKSPNGDKNRFHGLTYQGLKDDQTVLDLRTIRNIIVKQTSPEGSSAVFEIFSRLNTGSVNLTPQEIRASLYYSSLFRQIMDCNSDATWRKLIGRENPDIRMRDTEFLLRSLALAERSESFSGSMANFLNNYCLAVKKYPEERVSEIINSLKKFIGIFSDVETPFMRSAKFSGVLFESFYAAWKRLGAPDISTDDFVESVNDIKSKEEFSQTLQEGSTKPHNIKARIKLAEDSITARQ